jgi:DNA-binding MarR family transcriptional regulator
VIKKGKNSKKTKANVEACGSISGTSPELSHQHHMAWFNMLRARASVERLVEQRRHSTEVVPLGWYDVLLTLEKAPEGRLRMSELADNVMTSRSGLTRLVDRLVEIGYIERANCATDRRSCYAVITKEGLKARAASWPLYSQWLAEYFASHISEEEAAALAEILKKIGDANGAP